jgi:hypothetical protein
MLTELVRVACPGGKVGVIVRASDAPAWVNADLTQPQRARLQESRGRLVAPGGCDDSTLYNRFVDASLREIKMIPQLASRVPRRLPGWLSKPSSS